MSLDAHPAGRHARVPSCLNCQLPSPCHTPRPIPPPCTPWHSICLPTGPRFLLGCWCIHLGCRLSPYIPVSVWLPACLAAWFFSLPGSRPAPASSDLGRTGGARCRPVCAVPLRGGAGPVDHGHPKPVPQQPPAPPTLPSWCIPPGQVVVLFDAMPRHEGMPSGHAGAVRAAELGVFCQCNRCMHTNMRTSTHSQIISSVPKYPATASRARLTVNTHTRFTALLECVTPCILVLGQKWR